MAYIKNLVLTGGTSRSANLLIDNVILDLLEWDKTKPVSIKLDGRRLVVSQEKEQQKRGPKPKNKVKAIDVTTEQAVSAS